MYVYIHGNNTPNRMLQIKNYEIYKNFNVNTFMCMHVYLTKDINVSIYTYNVKSKMYKIWKSVRLLVKNMSL